MYGDDNFDDSKFKRFQVENDKNNEKKRESHYYQKRKASVHIRTI